MPTDSLSRWKKMQAELRSLWDETWIGDEDEAKPNLCHRLARFWIFVWRSFNRNRCPVRASSLAYTTLLGLVPLLALAISISTSLFKAETKQWVATVVIKLAPQIEIQSEGSTVNRDQVIDWINKFIDRIQSGALGITGLIALAFIAISMLSSIENTMNDIWGVQRGRSWFKRVIYYWTLVTLVPSLLLVAVSIKTGPYLDSTQDFIKQFPVLAWLVGNLVPLLILTPTFALFYYLMPNTKVEWRAARLGGLVAALLFHLNNHVSFIYFGQVVRNSKIYGSLAGFPVFLVGIYFSWMIMLLGAQVAYAYQNRRSYFQEKQADNINQRGREFLALRIVTLIAERFQKGLQPLNATQMAELLSVPSRLITKTIEPLLERNLIIEIAGEKIDEVGYTPGRPLAKISYQDILEAMRSGVGQEVLTKEDAMRGTVREKLERIQEAEREVAADVTLETILQGK